MTNVVVQNPDDSIILGTNDHASSQTDIESNVTHIETFSENELEYSIASNNREIYLLIDNINCTLTADFIINIISVVFIFKTLPISIINMMIIFYGYMAIYINSKPLLILFIVLLSFLIIFKMFLIVALFTHTYNFINVLSFSCNLIVLKNLRMII